MTIGITITCSAIEEPRRDIAPGGGVPLGAQLNLDIRNTVAPHDEPRAVFERFLDALPGVRFAAYSRSAPTLLKPVSTNWLGRIGSAPAGATAAVGAWLDRPASGHTAPVWVSEVQPPEGEISGDPALFSAGQRLAGAQTWPAPLPQEVGLTQIVELSSWPADPLYIVPFFFADAGAEPPEIAVAEVADQQGVVTFSQAVGTWGDVAFEIAPADRLPCGLVLIDPATGFLELEGSFELVTLVRRIREHSGSLFWTAPQLIGTEKPADDRNLRGQRIVWRAGSALCSILDPLFLTLAIPGSGEREGPLLGAILAEAANSSAPPPPAKQRAFVAEVKSWVRGHSLIGSQADREALVRLAAEKLLDRKELASLLGSAELVSGKGEVQFNFPASAAVLPPLLGLFRLAGPFSWPESVDFVDLEARLDQELTTLVQQMGSEDGFEAAVIAFFRNTEGRAALKTLLGGDSAAADNVLSTLTTQFSLGYNALEAARQAQGSVIANLLLANNPAADSAVLAQELLNSDWFSHRLRATNVVIPAHVKVLLAHVPMLSDYPVPPPETLGQHLAAAFVEVCADIGVGDIAKRRRFVPDTEPVDVPARLPIDLAANGGDPFGEAYDGLALLVRRAGDAKWAHANLARFDIGSGTGPLAIFPVQPARQDGESLLAYQYAGRPIAFSRPSPASEDGSYPPYFRFHPADEVADRSGWPPNFAKLPSLAYGTRFEFAAFPVSRNGVLPAGAARPVGEPDSYLFPAESPDPGIHRVGYDYSRTTSIGRVTIERAKATGGGEAFRAPLDHIQSLAADYPRTSLTASNRDTRWLDLWRGADGSGTFPLPAGVGQSVTVTLADVQLRGGGMVSFALMHDPRAEGVPMGALHLPPGFPGPVPELTLVIERSETGCMLTVAGVAQHFDIPADQLFWLRIILEAPAAQTATFVLADPQGTATGQSHGARDVPQDLLVLRPDTLAWDTAFSHKTTVRIVTPAMGLEDFDRWLANNALLAAAAAGHETKVSKFRVELLAMMEDLATGGSEDLREAWRLKKLAELLERYTGFLPDLAVGNLIVELTVVDALVSTAWGVPAQSRIIPIPTLGALLDSINYRPGDIERTLRDMSEKRQIEVRIEATAGEAVKLDWSGPVLVAKVPSGCVARLSVRPAIAEDLFATSQDMPPVIARGLLQHASGRHSDSSSMLFDGAGLTIEVMDAHEAVTEKELVALTNRGLIVAAAENARSYDLVFRPGDSDLWRHVGTADVTSQRWRHLGRPIYNWFDPRQNRHSPHSENSVVRLGRSAKVASFEAEAFDRGSEDSQTQSVRLNPRPAESRLHSESWDSASATIFRHRVTLRGRYAGALSAPGHSAWVVIGESNAGLTSREDWVRIAILGDRARIQLARPQLRLLMPLNRSPNDDLTPPLLAMMTEPPFAHGGLADRIASGVATGIGYEMKSNKLAVGDLRSEAGPDPYLSLHALKLEIANRVGLDAEGPIGLTFDRDNNSTAAFPNSAWVLSPQLLRGDGDHPDWQEHFLGVSMRRYLDPHWLAGNEAQGAMTSFPFGDTRWIEVGVDIQLARVWKEEGENGPTERRTEVLTIKRSFSDGGSGWSVSVFENAIFPDGKATDPFPLTQFQDPSVQGIALLHQPVDAGRAALSVFALMGEGRAPLLMGSVTWQSPQAAISEIRLFSVDGKDEIDASKVQSWLTAASMPTTCEWARTGRNVAKILGTPIKAAGATALHEIATLKLQPDGAGAAQFVSEEGTALWLRPSQHDSPHLQYVQRCLAVLHTELAPGNGRDLEVFGGKEGAFLLLGRRVRNVTPASRRVTRVIEFEIPARPLTSEDPLLLPRDMQKTVFDLREVAQEGAPALLLLVKPYKPARARAGYSLTMNVSAPATHMSYRFDLATDKSPQQIVILQTDDTGKAWYIDSMGIASAVVYGVREESGSSSEGEVVMTACVPGDPWWADASLLALPERLGDQVAPDALPLIFDWLFGNSNDALETAMTHGALRELAGAQARIVSVSPPIVNT